MGSSYESIYTKLGSREHVQHLHQQDDLSDRKKLKLEYLNEAFAVYLESKKSQTEVQKPQTLEAYKELAQQNPDFTHYYTIKLLFSCITKN
ncbi:hypothetical protein OQJ26_10435 [Legionella sp. PATHC038]|uniref:hypothetical protein n=1 Tax=Legionella sheltonii TaxID=2992041 RepID=UPI0022445F19|nr:hypothetical protein [Legionella sp. PATHC038]MCW8399208.1 hypothetical protein [Legionella sp. PATHC038]